MHRYRLEINKRIEVIWNKKTYKSLIQDISEEEFKISIPMAEYEYLPLDIGAEVEIIYYLDKDYLYKFSSVVTRRAIGSNIPLLVMKRTSEIKKVQRRNHVRINMLELISYSLIADNEKDTKIRKALLLDLSGGGMKIKIGDKLQQGDIIRAHIPCFEEVIEVKGRIIRIEQTEDKQYICGIGFSEINDYTREKIIKRVFDVMRKQRELL